MERIILISCEASDSLIQMLSRYGEVRLLPTFSALPKPVSSHADMLTFMSEKEGILYVPSGYYEANKDVFSGMAIEVIDEELGDKYPNDIYLDALCVGEYLICRSSHTAKKIKTGRKIIEVKQGYAKCSVCLLGEKGAVTADRGLKKALEDIGISVLPIESGNIHLGGYSYGFIGGASVVIGKSVIFFGNIERHPEGQKILEFLESKGYRAEYPEDMVLTDLGSAVVINRENHITKEII